jgi:phenylacetate-CoA ligase
LAFLDASDSWSAQQVAAWQLRQFNRLVVHALAHVPGHSRKFRAFGVSGPVRSLDEISRFPYFGKDELRTSPEDFTARNFASKVLKSITSGGTTGTPTRFLVNARSYDPVFLAWRHAMWRRAGYHPAAPALDLTWAFQDGGLMRASNQARRSFLSIHALTAHACGLWLDRVLAMKPEFLIAFPSTATAFAILLPPGALCDTRGVLLASEGLSVSQRETISAAFPSARIFCWYGMSEMAGFASYCEHADTFHHWPQSGLLEIIDESGAPVCSPGCSGEIVLTGFLNWPTPFIRYRTGDRATLGEPCPQCRRPSLVLTTIDGRLDDFLVSARGRVVPISALNFHSDEFQHVFAHQFVQDEAGRVELRLAPLDGFGEVDAARLSRFVQERLGPDFLLTLQVVSSVARTQRGKQPLIIRHCSPPTIPTGTSSS